MTRGPGAIPLVALFGVAVRRWSHEPWEKSFFVRLGTRLARAWHATLLRWPRRPLWIAAAAVGALYFCVSLLRHWAFESHGYDLGIFTNAIWNLTQGNGYVSSVKGGINLFADHQSPTFWLLAPLFWLIPRPETLLFANVFARYIVASLLTFAPVFLANVIFSNSFRDTETADIAFAHPA